jgi:ABC-type Na+ transport system ATPase subunit NatA
VVDGFDADVGITCRGKKLKLVVEQGHGVGGLGSCGGLKTTILRLTGFLSTFLSTGVGCWS